jgi:hypothetical protein
MGVGEGALHVAEELALQEALGHGAAVHGHETARRGRGESAWIALATSSFPVPLSPVMRAVGVRGGDRTDDVEDRRHARGDANDPVEAVAGVELGLEEQVLSSSWRFSRAPRTTILSSSTSKGFVR